MSTQTESRVARSRRAPASPEAAAASEHLKTPAAPAIAGRRNPKWIALGVVALCLGALLSYVLYSRAANEESVVAVVNTVHRGDTLSAKDLTTVKLSASSGVKVVPASQLSELVGRKAVYDLVGGALLPVGAVASVVVPQTGRAVVGIRLVAGRVPSGQLPAGTPLRLIAIPPAGTDPNFTDDYTGRVIIARHISQADSADGTSIVINVDVPAAQAPVVALLAAQERLAVVRDADR
jgi:hypothetical protein